MLLYIVTAGFEEAVKTTPFPISLHKLCGEYSGAVGAAILGAKKAGEKININYKDTTEVFYTSGKF